ncbi:MAG: CDP-glucose 4,6-dehydratase [Methylomonas sp.]|nr:CDP-glucose 4,6-dehydratase [Methylomonas sp.]
MGINTKFWRGKRVCLTGHTGFKGSWLTIWLNKLGADVTGVSLPPETMPNLFTLAKVAGLCRNQICDIRDIKAVASIIQATQPDIVFHLAAQPLVRVSYRQPVETFSTNVMGTVHVLDSMRGVESTRVAVMITTDKVYRNNEWPWPYRENDALGGHDPYSASKAASEIVIASYRDAFLSAQGVAVASARAGNVIGGGDWGEDRLIPDAVRAWQAGQILQIRRPNAIRPWQHVLEPLAGYLKLAEKLWSNQELASAYNFGPHTNEISTVRDVIELARNSYGSGQVNYGDEKDGLHEAGRLALEISKARAMLNVNPTWGLAETIKRTMSWYRSQHQGSDTLALCLAEIDDFEATL